MALPHSFTGGKKHKSASQVTRSEYNDLVDLGTSSESQLHILVCICPPSLGLPPASPLLSLTQPNQLLCVCVLAECHDISFCSLSLWLNSALLYTNTHSVCANSMMCLLKILMELFTVCKQHSHPLSQTSLPPSLGSNQGSICGPIFYRQEN